MSACACAQSFSSARSRRAPSQSRVIGETLWPDLQFSNFVLPLTRVSGGLRHHPHQGNLLLPVDPEGDRPVGADDDFRRGGLHAPVAGDPQRAETVVALEGTAASTGHSRDLTVYGIPAA